MIDTAVSEVIGIFNLGSGNTGFGLNTSLPEVGSSLIQNGSDGGGNGGVDVDNSTLVFSAVSTVSTPEPTTIFGLLLMGGVGLLSKRQKQAQSIINNEKIVIFCRGLTVLNPY